MTAYAGAISLATRFGMSDADAERVVSALSEIV